MKHTEKATQTGLEEEFQTASQKNILKNGNTCTKICPSIFVNSETRDSLDNMPLAVTHCKETRGATPSGRKTGNVSRLSRSRDNDDNLFEKRNFLSTTSLSTLESQAAVRLATYEKMSPRCWRRSMAV